MKKKKHICKKCKKSYVYKKAFDNHTCKIQSDRKKRPKNLHYNINNKFNEVWTLEETIKFFMESYRILKEDEKIVFIGTLACKMNTYKDVYIYLYKKFSTSKEIRSLHKNIHSLIESRLFDGSLNNKFNASIAKFGLSCNHKWSEQNEKKEANIDGTIELE